MSRLPVVPHHDVDPEPKQVAKVEALAERLAREDPVLRRAGPNEVLLANRLEDAPTLHLDDLGEIPLIERFRSSVFLEDRARLRAEDGDFVATCARPNPGFEEYTEKQLGLGVVTWLHPVPRAGRLCVATACWTDFIVRRRLVEAMRCGELRYVHPNMGTNATWTMARLLENAGNRPLSVIAPPPNLTRKVNNKIWFTHRVEELFGSHMVPRTMEVFNYTALAAAVRHLLSDGSRSIVVKIPDSAGGSGNHILDPRRVRGGSVGDVRRRLKRQLADLPWEPGSRLLVGIWESDVLAAPSSQLWIPPETDGPPIVEGVFEQAIGGPLGEFRGSRPARLPSALVDDFATRSWLLARLFQRLRYVGRCSFDSILVGSDLRSCRLELIECNGRWGGTSSPMTLVNRLRGDWREQPYSARKCTVDGLSAMSFDEVLASFGSDAFDARTREGSLIFYNPGRLRAHSGIDVVAFAGEWDEADRVVRQDVLERLRAMVFQSFPARNTGE